jgi:hypothetical protein
MARIVIVQHEIVQVGLANYSLMLLVNEWEQAGHEILHTRGIEDLPAGDVAVVHVDLSVVPPAYVEATRRYPRVVNGQTLDIRKRTVSRDVIAKGEDWSGTVIVKTDFNCGGLPEARTATAMEARGIDLGLSKRWLSQYRLFKSLDEVPAETWDDPLLVVEKFLPEREGDRFYLRTWIFLGPQELCRRFSGTNPIVKGADYSQPEIVDVPMFLRAERERLGFDYGKFDFVIHDGAPILLDANKTPGIPPPSRVEQRAAYSDLAPGLDWFLDTAPADIRR